jgi:hypothetical protein
MRLSVQLRHVTLAVIFFACLPAVRSFASVQLSGDPGPIGGPPQTFSMTIPAGTLADDMTHFVIDFPDEKFIQLTGNSAIQFEVSVRWKDATLIRESYNLPPLLSLLDENGLPVSSVSGSSAYSSATGSWNEIDTFLDVNVAAPFYGMKWLPFNDIPEFYGPSTVVDSGTLKVIFLNVNGTVGDGVVPEPASVAVWSLLGIIGIGYGWRRKRQKR